MKKQLGVWLDFKEANIVEWDGESTKVTHFLSKIENFHPKGGSRSSSPYGPVDKISEGKYLQRRQHQEQQYYERLMQALINADEIYLFGPAEAKNRLAKRIQIDKRLAPLLKAVETVDSMTEPQIAAKVRTFFSA